MRAIWRRAWSVGLVWGLLGTGVVQAQEGPAPALTRSPETTFFTGPIHSDGTVDYVEALNAELGKGVARERNAAVVLLDAVEAGRPPNAVHYAKVRAKLAMPRAGSPVGQGAVGDAGQVAAFAGADPAKLDLAMRAPWTAEQAPDVAAWLKGLEGRLARAVQASGRDQFYMPMVREQPDDPMMLILLPHLAEQRSLVQGLRARSMLALGNDDGEAFRRDAVAIVRIGRLNTRASTVLERLVGILLETAGLQAMQVAASGGWLSGEQAEQILADLRTAPEGLAPLGAFDQAERACVLELLQARAAHGGAVVARFMQGTNEKLPDVGPATPAEWDAAMRDVNGWYDRVGELRREPAFARRVERVPALEAELAKLRGKDAAGPVTPKVFAHRVVGAFMSSFGQADVTETRVRVDREMTEAALALSAFRTKSGEYPAALKELVPAYLKAEPVDAFTGEVLSYHAGAGGYMLHSRGANGRDDTGRTGAANDDRVVRAER